MEFGVDIKWLMWQGTLRWNSDESEIGFVNGSVFKLGGEMSPGIFMLGEYQRT